MPKTITLEEIEKEITRLTPQQQLKLVETLAHNLRKAISLKKERGWKRLYGLGKGLWKEDAQNYVNRLREDRTLQHQLDLCPFLKPST